MTLPIEAVLPDLLAALRSQTAAVLVAPPGAGKSTRVPLALMGEAWRGSRRILVLQPRRLAARAAARRMAETLGEPVGETVGYRVRMDAKVSARTRVEVVTAGVFTRMITADPELCGVAAVLFDEVHERGLDSDLGLALALDVQAALRDDLRVIAMSATADAAGISALLGGAPVIESAGRSFPVEIRYRPGPAGARIEEITADCVCATLREETGSLLVFLPGRAEIERTLARLADRVASDVDLVPLHGGLDGKAQDAAIRPPASGRRKVVLATPIAETSITIDGVRVVIDCGYARRPRFEPATGLTRLVTERVSRAAADQRSGRAGRTGPGIAIRLWAEGQTASLPAFDPPEILEADLSGLVLDLADWGVRDPADLTWLDPPPGPAWREAVQLLTALDALDERGGITPEGRALRALPLPPRLAHMIHAAAGRDQAGIAAEVALVLTEQGLGGRDTNLAHRLDLLRSDRSARATRARETAARWAQAAGARRAASASAAPSEVGRLLALAFPDRIAQARGKPGSYRTASGRGAVLDPADTLARERYLAVGELQGAAQNARILLAAPLDQAAIESDFAERIVDEESLAFDPDAAAVRLTRRRLLGALVLSEVRSVPSAGPETLDVLMAAIGARGLSALPFSETARQLKDRLSFLRRSVGEPWPDVSDEALAAAPADWLAPFVPGAVALSDIKSSDLEAALSSMLLPHLSGDLDRLAPARLTTPSGRSVAIDYRADEPTIAVRVQDLFGLANHPVVAAGRSPLVVHLLSPADRPVQVTRDLPGFWAGSWSDVRKDLRGRYPKHNWPEDPATSPPTRLRKDLR
ncbi:ATP-dependent helicase HrpB [Amorphus orientalis]|uniref:RNA helicase n=1 Tax=Amorphus orientalis TaxID=649198 RepID=A0AAE4ARH8_9HYPH|nr:ATP-dependent helicase HrpB [Amorphus orientalis]MDQ0315191.1 ATP-dependent helicase HrpB [Amorphus orientalis]